MKIRAILVWSLIAWGVAPVAASASTGEICAAKAGAAVVHCHVREPESGAPSRRVDLYRELTERIRAADVDVVINLTAGMGGDLTLEFASDGMSFFRVRLPVAETA